MEMAGKIALITGAGGEIGAAVARRLCDAGAKVALLDQNEVDLLRVANEIGPNASCHTCDVSSEADVERAISEAVIAHGRIDIGVLNAGISARRMPLQDIDVELFDRIMAVNTRGVFLGMKHLFPTMQRQGGGAIVVTASTESLRGNVGIAAYTASKHAVAGLVKTAALEWAQHNIRVNCVNPGPVDTRMIRAVEQASIDNGIADIRERGTKIIPMKRYAQAIEVANFIAYLASDEASYSTGGTYLLDGGVLAGKLATE